MPSAQTRISTDRASRYLTQLCEHLNHLGHNPRRHAGTRSGHGPDVQRVEWNETHGVIEFPFGTCDLTATEDALTIRLTADEPDALRHLQDMITARVETIGRRDDLEVTWLKEGPSANTDGSG